MPLNKKIGLTRGNLKSPAGGEGVLSKEDLRTHAHTHIIYHL